MATITNRLAFIISANADQAIKGFDKTATAAERQLGKAQNKIDNLGVSMVKFGATGLAVAGTLGAGLYKMGQQASNLAETVSKTRVVFGAASKEIEEFGKTAAKNLGLSNRSALDASSTFALFGKSAGLSGKDLTDFSKKLVVLSADFASFFNTEPEDAIQAIGAALRGEAEPIRRYNILLNDMALKQEATNLKIYDGEGALTAQQKVLAAQSAILKQSSDAQGDFARTAEGLANQQRILSATSEDLSSSVGQGVLPIMTRATNFANSAGDAFIKLDTTTGGLIGTMAGFGVAGLAVVSAFSLIGGQTIKMRNNFKDADGNLNNLGRTAKAASSMLALVAIVETAGAAVSQLGGFARETDKRLNALLITAGKTDNTKDLVTQFANLADQLKNADTSVSGFFKQFGKAIRIAGADTDAGRIAIEYLDEAFNDVAGRAPELGKKIIDALRAQSASLDKNGATYKDNMMLVARYTEQLKLTKGAIDSVTDAQQEETEKAEASVEAKKRAEERAKKYADAQKKLKDTVVQSADALRSKLNTALDAAKNNLKAATEEFNNYSKSISNAVTGSIGFGSAQQTAADNIKAVRDATSQVADAQTAYNSAKSKDDPDATAEAYKRLTQAQEDLAAVQSSPKTFMGALQAQETSAKSFAGNIQKLLDLGANQGVIDQLVSAGAETGNAIATEILGSADPAGYVGQINTIVSSTQAIADQVGKNSAAKFKQAGVDSATALLTGMNEVLSKAKIQLKFGNLNKKGKPIKTLRDLKDQLQNDMTGLFTVGGFSGDDIPQLADGGVVRARSGGTLALLGEGGRDEAVIPLPKSGGAVGGGAIYVTVNAGVGDPIAIGAALVDVLQKYQSRTGSLPLKVR
jgi:hypothetical protein